MARRVIIAGSRHFNDARLVFDILDKHFKDGAPDEIVSGGAAGVDTIAQAYAEARGYFLKVFKADWDAWGQGTGPKGNALMAEYGTELVAFPMKGGRRASKGTWNMIQQARKKGLAVKIVEV